MMSRNGIPYKLLKNIINNIQNRANEILIMTTNFSIKIVQKTREKEKKSYINVYKIENKNIININNCSGYERFITGLILRVAIIESSNISGPNCMFIDEGFSCMDKSNLQNVKIIFNKLKELFDFTLIVSHLDELKCSCDNYINITKKNIHRPSSIRF